MFLFLLKKTKKENMAEKEKITSEKVKYNGFFDFKEVYQFVYRWLNEEDYDVEEEKYIEEVSGDFKKVEIVWKATKGVYDVSVDGCSGISFSVR